MAKAMPPGDFECPVCHEEFTEPKLLPCTHRMCKKCVLSWLQAKESSANCPLCRVPILSKQNPESNLEALVDDLPTDLVTMALVESKNALSGDRLCSVCEDDIHAASFCFDCNIRLCKTCAKERESLAEEVRRLRDKEANFSAEISQIEKDVQDAEAHFSAMREEVKTNLDRLQQAVTKRRQELNTHIHDFEIAFFGSNATTKSLLEERKSLLAAHVNTFDQIVTSSADSTFIGMLSKVKQRLDDLKAEIQRPVQKSDVGMGSVTFDTKLMQRVKRVVAVCGDVSETKSSAAATSVPAADKDKHCLVCGSAHERPADGTWLFVPFEEPQYVVSRGKKTNRPTISKSLFVKTANDTLEPNISSMAVTGEGILVVTDTANSNIKARSLVQKGHVVSISLPNTAPRCVAALEGNLVAMTSLASVYAGKRITFLTVSGQPPKIEEELSISTIKPYHTVCAGPGDTLIAAARDYFEAGIRRRASIDVISRADGHVQRSVAADIASQFMLSPFYMCVDREGSVYVSDVSSNKVWKLPMNREVEAPRFTSMTEPGQIAADEDKSHVYVVNDRCVMVRKNNTKWRVLIRGEELKDCGKLQAVCVWHKNLYIAGLGGCAKLSLE
ncbi:hypothetical protein BaRGS_00040418 [Batillaria attramentaria]|uniref:RING-type domain-containing protein n=1 Tax=Batillaria attramentaria TaxID=370345 RepID=A0ABD0J089_9CAEN